VRDRARVAELPHQRQALAEERRRAPGVAVVLHHLPDVVQRRADAPLLAERARHGQPLFVQPDRARVVVLAARDLAEHVQHVRDQR
jgi:hypothetical protein